MSKYERNYRISFLNSSCLWRKWWERIFSKQKKTRRVRIIIPSLGMADVRYFLPATSSDSTSRRRQVCPSTCAHEAIPSNFLIHLLRYLAINQHCVSSRNETTLAACLTVSRVLRRSTRRDAACLSPINK